MIPRAHILTRDGSANGYVVAAREIGWAVRLFSDPECLIKALIADDERVDCLVLDLLTSKQRRELLGRLRLELPPHKQPVVMWITTDTTESLAAAEFHGELTDPRPGGLTRVLLQGAFSEFRARLCYLHEWTIRRVEELPTLIVVHGVNSRGGDPVAVPFSTCYNGRSCGPDEQILDITLEGISLLVLGERLPDPTRRADLYVLERLIRASRWNQRISPERLASSLTDTSRFVFAGFMAARYYDDVSPDIVKNAIKRLRGAFGEMGLDGHKVIEYQLDLGYTFNFARCSVKLMHVPQ